LAAAEIRFYLDENLPVEIARQLRSRDIDVVTVRELERLGEEDIDHLRRAAEMGSALCNYDAYLLALAAEGVSHAGIVFGQQDLHYIGTWVNRLELLHAMYTAEDMHNRIEYL
jgi:hypothetical protein